MLSIESAKSTAAGDPLLEHVGHHALQRHASCSHLRDAFVSAVALPDFELVDVEHCDEAHPRIFTLFHLAEGKDWHTLKMLATDLAQKRHLIRIRAWY